MLARLGIAALVGAAALGYMTYTEGVMASRSSGQPETIGLKQLIARGPDGNANVIVTDFVLCGNLVHEFNENNKASWTHVWIPIVPAEQVDKNAKDPPNPQKVHALFFSTSIRNEPELEKRLNRPQVRGLVTNRIASLDTKIRNLLQQSYPGTDFDTCLIIQEGREPFGLALVALTGGGAVLCAIVGLVLLVIGFRK